MKRRKPRSVARKATERIVNREPEDLPEDTEPLSIDGKKIQSMSPEYDAELQYEGYHRIEEYDDDVYNADMDQMPDDGKELNFDERP